MESEACLMYALNGNSIIYGSDRSITIGNEQSVLMKCGNFVSNWKVTETTVPYEVIAIHFFPDVLKAVFDPTIPEYLSAPRNKNNIVFHKIRANAILKSYINSLMVYFDNPSLFTEDSIKLKLRELIGLLYQLDGGGVRAILSDMFNPHRAAFKKVVAAHLFHNLSLDEFATLLNISVSTFKRKFKEVYHTTPGQYITKKKLDRAARLLKTSEERVTDICYDCGFGDLSNFTKLFSKHYGFTPSDYREKRGSELLQNN